MGIQITDVWSVSADDTFGGIGEVDLQFLGATGVIGVTIRFEDEREAPAQIEKLAQNLMTIACERKEQLSAQQVSDTQRAIFAQPVPKFITLHSATLTCPKCETEFHGGVSGRCPGCGMVVERGELAVAL